MIITREQLEQLSRIYNTMLEIRTKGEDTLVMADCLRALEQVITQIMQAGSMPTQAPAAGTSDDVVEE
jgi:hypothetical protein